MYASNYHIHTQKEAPAEAEIISHQLMTRAGLIRRLAGGIYTYMPLGLRVIRKIEQIVREEMDRAGAVELLMPFVQPAELWQETGRWQECGPELLRIKEERKSTRLNSSHVARSSAVFGWKKKRSPLIR